MRRAQYREVMDAVARINTAFRDPLVSARWAAATADDATEQHEAEMRAQHEAKRKASAKAHHDALERAWVIGEQGRHAAGTGGGLMFGGGLLVVAPYLVDALASPPPPSAVPTSTEFANTAAAIIGGFQFFGLMAVVVGLSFLVFALLRWQEARRVVIPPLYLYDPDDGVITRRAVLDGLNLSPDVRDALTRPPSHSRSPLPALRWIATSWRTR